MDFERASDQLADGMNAYLNSIHQKTPTSWTQREVRVRLDEKRFRFLIGDRRWNSQLGGTLSLYFLISYHYSLMSLADKEGCHFPGFVVLDFQAELEDGPSVADSARNAVKSHELLGIRGMDESGPAGIRTQNQGIMSPLL